MSLAHNLMAGDIFAIARRLPAINRLPVHLGQQDMRDGPQNRVRRPFQQIRKPHQQPAFAQPNRIVDIGKREKFDLQFWNGRTRPQFLIGFLEDFKQPFAHGELRLARETGVRRVRLLAMGTSKSLRSVRARSFAPPEGRLRSG